MKGIDVSRWQGNIDWSKVKTSGIELAVIKMSQGGSAYTAETAPVPYLDPCFKTNVTNAHSAGINRIGVYHYLAGTTVETVKKEAQFVIANIAPYKKMLSLPIALDIEDVDKYPKYRKLSTSVNGQLVKTFRDELKNSGYETMLYSNKDFLSNVIDMSSLKDMPIWYARWTTGSVVSEAWEKTIFTEQPNTVMWQYGECKVSGISGSVDANVGYFDIKQMTDNTSTIHEGDTVKIKSGAMYKGGIAVPARLYGLAYTAGRVVGDYVYIATLNSWIQVSGLELIRREEPDYIRLVCEKCGFEEQTKTYINAYKWASDLWRKLWENMK